MTFRLLSVVLAALALNAQGAELRWSSSLPSADGKSQNRFLEYYAPTEDEIQASVGALKPYFLLIDGGTWQETRFTLYAVTHNNAGGTTVNMIAHVSGIDSRKLEISINHHGNYRLSMTDPGKPAVERLMGHLDGRTRSCQNVLVPPNSSPNSDNKDF